DDPVVLNHVNNSTAKPIYDSSIFILRNTYEELIVKLFEDYTLTRTLKDSYTGAVNDIALWKLYIMTMALASHYDAYGYLPESYNDAFYYQPLKPPTAPAAVSPVTPAAPKPATKTLQQKLDEVGKLAKKYRY